MRSRFPSLPAQGDGDEPRYATAGDWQDILKNRARFKMHEIIERLGLRAEWSANKRGKAKFDSPKIKDLVNDMAQIIKSLPKESEELITCLAAPDSLKDEVDKLLATHGSTIWGRVSDRVHLVNAGEVNETTEAEVDVPGLQQSYYPRDLFYEEDDDRKLIRMLLHWWLGLKACNVILARDRLHRDRHRKAERLQKKQKLEEIARGLNPPVPKSGPVHLSKEQVLGLRLNTSYQGVQVSPLTGTPVDSNDSPAPFDLSNGFPNAYPATSQGSPHTGAVSYPTALPAATSQGPASHPGLSYTFPAKIAADIHPPISSSLILPPASSQQVGAEIGNLVHRFLADRSDKGHNTPPTNSNARTAPEEAQQTEGGHGLDLETLMAFRSYIYPSVEGPKWDEVKLLRRLETAWCDRIRSSRNLAAGKETRFVAIDRAFLTWIELRRHMADLSRANEVWRQQDEEQSVDQEARISQHKTLMSASRDVARTWDDIEDWLRSDNASASEGLTADHLLVEAFKLLASDCDSATAPDTHLVWPQMDVKATVQWLRGHLEQFAAIEADVEEPLLYVRC